MKNVFILILVALLKINITSYNMFEYKNEIKYLDNDTTFFTSTKVDFIQIQSSLNDSIRIAIAIYKPEQTSPILLTTHGWHGSITRPSVNDKNPFPDFITIDVDMRGRKFSSGKPDCNGYELYDFYDAYKYVVKNYSEFISDQGQVYFRGESGGGGNGYGLLGKFPDLFCSAMITCGPSDYKLWYQQDKIGEFRDEMVTWIGSTPEENPIAYNSRSGITIVQNLITPVYICHSETDFAVPSIHGRIYYQKALKFNKKIEYLELKGVGHERHWGNITEEQEEQKKEFINYSLKYHEVPLLPDTGVFIVAGFLVTKKFSVFMESIDDLGMVKFNITDKKINFVKGKGEIIWNIP